ncbi:unnamed protein product [Linum tenue]|uniref:Uncharacterized protein n=1 Tax=Linum tenue TaxID=586396 RepID=A0AAV0RZ46_9ROSI|nr:unnamed protein product [Linum tenue]CAI0626466.1 unnamed protein product [Linum tenue]
MLARHIQSLMNFRYLDLSCNDEMTRLPKFITMLLNLLEIIVCACKSLQEISTNLCYLLIEEVPLVVVVVFYKDTG